MQQRVASLLGINPLPPSLKDGLIYADRGPTVPADGTAGYGVGAVFQHTDGGNGTALYVNEGTATSCDFNAVAVAGTGEVTTAQLADDAVTEDKIADDAVTEDKIADDAVTEDKIANDAVTGDKIADGAIDDAAKIEDGVVTPPKLSFAGLKFGSFAARNGAGACTLTGAEIGDRVIGGWLSGDVSDNNTKGEGSVVTSAAFAALFEAAITVADQIQQTSASDLSDDKYTVLLAPAAA